MDDPTNAEIMVAMRTYHEEQSGLVERCIKDQVDIRAQLTGLVSRVEAFEARGGAWDAQHSGHNRALTDVKADVDSTLQGISARHDGLAQAINNVDANVNEMKANVEASVLSVLGAHVTSLEESADRLAKAPRVKAAAAIGGTFAGSALVALAFEIWKLLSAH